MKEIYAILSPATGDIRYIGQSADARTRMETLHWPGRHWQSKRDTPLSTWLRQWDECPPIRVLSVVEDAEAFRAEAAAIQAARRAFPGRLLNIHPKPSPDSPEWLNWAEYAHRCYITGKAKGKAARIRRIAESDSKAG